MLTWLPNSLRKNVELPKVVFEQYSKQPYGGFYINNTITVVEAAEERNVAATLAHEFKHHLQSLSGTLQPNTFDIRLFNCANSYNLAIRDYFRTQRHEMEALLFQEKYAKTEVGRFWLKGLVLPCNFNPRLEI